MKNEKCYIIDMSCYIIEILYVEFIFLFEFLNNRLKLNKCS